MGASYVRKPVLFIIGHYAIVRPEDKRYPTVSNEYRKLHKRVYQINSDGKLSVKLGTWSTR
jgi:hypothetical protein